MLSPPHDEARAESSSQTDRPWRSRRDFLARAGIVVVLLILTYWNIKRTTTLDEARAALARGDLKSALRVALDSLQRRPGDPAAALLAARCLNRLRYADQAEPYYQVAERAGLLTLEDLHDRALGLGLAIRRSEAIAVYREILRRRPDDVAALQRMATLTFVDGRVAEALELADRLARVPAGVEVGHLLIGVFHHDQRHRDKAAALYMQVLALDPELHKVPLAPDLFWTDLTEDLMGTGRSQEARRLLSEALQRGGNPTLMPVLIDLLGRTLEREGRDDDAERCWRQATEWDPQLSGPWMNLGVLALNRGRVDEAVRLLRGAVARAPSDQAAVYNLGLALRRLGRTAEAERTLRKAERLRRLSAPKLRGMGTLSAALP